MPYFHHGIFVGGNVGVIHFGGENKTDAKIKDDDLIAFWGTKRLMKITYPRRKPIDPKIVMDTAKELKDNPAKWGSFNLMNNNCEHFATYCKIGKAVSTQVNEKMEIMLANPKPIAALASSASVTAATNYVLKNQ